jgi:hypothetical protein
MADLDTAFLRPLGAEPSALRYQAAFTRAAIGAGWDSTAAIEAALLEEARRSGMLAQMQARGARNFFAPSMVYGLTLPRTSWAALDTVATGDLKTQMVMAYSRRDTARLRRIAVSMDSVAHILVNGLISDTGLSLAAAESFLILRDSAAALRSVRFILDTAITPIGLTTSVLGVPYWVLVPRATLLRADLAAALGQRDEAREWYRRFLDLWSTADPEFRPIVDRARKGYIAAGGTP